MYLIELSFWLASKHGLRGYLLESSLNNHLLMTMFLVPGVLLIDPALADWLASRLGDATQEPLKTRPLTPREREIDGLVKQGFSSKDIAKRLCITEKTVSKHRENTSRKVNENNHYPPTKE